ncbi:acyltransferase family protein [Pseudomonas sp. 210_17 TE3656]
MKNRFAYLDVLRIIAVVLVMYGHYVSVGGGATVIPGIINADFPLPLIDSTSWSMWKFEIFLIEAFSTQTAILGVTLFFIITGYLMPMMLERYTRRGFLINRFFRIFPVLLVALVVIGVFAWASQGIVFNASSYFASLTLTYLIFGVVPVAGVLWTLFIEVAFYIFSAVIGRFSVYKLYAFQILLLVLIICSVKWPNYYYLTVVASQFKYMLMICMGSAIYLAEREECWYRRVSLVLGALVLTYLGFQYFRVGHEDISTYNNFGTQLLALSLFLFFYLISKLGYCNRSVSLLADLVYPIYLLHTALGLGTMALVRGVTTNPYILLVSAILVTVIASWLLHKFVEVPSISAGRRFAVRPVSVTQPVSVSQP